MAAISASVMPIALPSVWLAASADDALMAISGTALANAVLVDAMTVITVATVAAVNTARRSGLRPNEARIRSPAATAVASSKRVQTTSIAAAGFECHGVGPIGRPVVRVTTYSATIAAEPTAPVTNSHRRGRYNNATANATCSQAMTAKNAPKSQYSWKCSAMIEK